MPGLLSPANTLRLMLAAIVFPGCLVGSTVAQDSPAPEKKYRGLICRGVEEGGAFLIGQLGFGPHLVSLFSTGPVPLPGTRTPTTHVAWVNDPRHSYVADGTGALCIWAHPAATDGSRILDVPGLAGIEIQHGRVPSKRDELWDGLLMACYDSGRPFLWGFAADDTHSHTRIGQCWYAARLAEVNEFALKSALRTGAFYASNGPAIEDIQVQDRTITLKLEQPDDVLWLRGGQFIGVDANREITVTSETGKNRCVKLDRTVRTSSLDLDQLKIELKDLKFVRAIVQTDPNHLAQTQPWRISKDTIHNQYPTSGTWVRGQTHNHTDTPPGPPTQINAYRLAYQAKGMLASFCTDYGYWETRYQWLPEDGTPQISSVKPNRCSAGESVEALIKGVNLKTGASVQIGDRKVSVLDESPAGLRIAIPKDLPPGNYDVCVTNPDRFRDTLPLGFTVQNRDADNEGWSWHGVADGLPYHRTTCVAAVGADVWVGTMVGISRLQKGAWKNYTKLPGPAVYAMTADQSGGLWLACAAGLAHRSADGSWTSHRVDDTFTTHTWGQERWGQLALSPEGTLWVANRWSRGLGVRRDGTWHRLSQNDGIPGNWQFAVACDSSGRPWIGFRDGLYRLAGEQWEKVNPPPELKYCPTTLAVAPTPDGAVWTSLASNTQPDLGGVVRFKAGETLVFTPKNSPLPIGRIRDILVSRTGDVWFASEVGLARLDSSGQWRVFTSVNSGLRCDLVVGLAEDSKGRIWLATGQGAACTRFRNNQRSNVPIPGRSYRQLIIRCGLTFPSAWQRSCSPTESLSIS